MAETSNGTGSGDGHRCSLCDAAFDTVDALGDHLTEEHETDVDAHQVRQLRELVERFDEGMDKALSLKREKQRLEDRVRELKAEKSQLHDTVDDLRDTRNTLKQELKEKENRVRDLEAQIKAKKQKDAVSEADMDALESKVELLREENRELRESLDHTTQLFDRLHAQAKELEEG